ncbi:MAG: amidohydrolase family protein [Gammaproteobacteria bacterium]
MAVGNQFVIDGDGHVVEHPLELLGEHLEKKYRDRAFFIQDGNGTETLVLDEIRIVMTSPDKPFNAGDALTPMGIRPGRTANRKVLDAHPGGFNAKARLEVHDAEGVDAAVLFPTLANCVAGLRDPLFSAAMCRAVNRWLAAYASYAPDELYPIAAVPVQHGELAADVLREAVREQGFIGAAFRANVRPDGRTVADRSLEVLWSTAQDLGVPICIHNADYQGDDNLTQPGSDWVQTRMMHHAILHPFMGMLAFASMYEAGIFERYPKLKIGYMESNCGWAPFWLDRLDEHLEIMGWMTGKDFKREPTEVFKDQCVVGCETEEPMIPYVLGRLGDDKVIWASDFPHYDAHVPGLTAELFEREDITDAMRDGILRRSSIRFYGLDEQRIRNALARRRKAA